MSNRATHNTVDSVGFLTSKTEAIESELADLRQRLADLRSERESIDVQLREGADRLAQGEEELTNYRHALAVLRDAAGPSGPPAKKPGVKKRKSGNEATRSGATVADRILSVLSENPKAEWTVRELQDQLPEVGPKVLSNTTLRLHRRGLIIRARAGHYKLPS